MKFAALSVFLLLASTSLAQRQFMPPIEGLKNFGCTADGYSSGTYLVHVWADYSDGRQTPGSGHGWIALYAVREGKNAPKKASDDCGMWVEQVNRLLAKRRKRK